MRRLLVSSLPGELRLALLDEGALADLRVELDRQGGEAGDIFSARISHLDRKLKLAFCDLGGEEDGILPLGEAPVGISEGDRLILRVQRAPSLGKGPKLAIWQGKLPGGIEQNRAPGLLLRGGDPVLALLEGGEDPGEILLDDPAMLQRLKRLLSGSAPQLLERLRLYSGKRPLFEQEGIEEEIEKLLRPEVSLAGGGRLWIEPTRALVAVDVDAAGAADPGKVNQEAARELARQLRLRNLSGLIAIDFLDPGGPEARRSLREIFEAALAQDPAATELQRIGGDGVTLLTRQRLRPALHELLCDRQRAWRLSLRCEGFAALRLAVAEGLENPGRQIVILAAERLLDLFAGPLAPAAEAAGKRLGQPLVFRAKSAAEADDRPFELVLE